MSKNIRIERKSGAALIEHISDLASLRIEVFRDFPYLYDGDFEYEKNIYKLILIAQRVSSFWHLMVIKSLARPQLCR